jgi:hypothetical protein
MEKYLLVFSLICILIIIILTIKLSSLKKELDDKNVRLIQFYLDKKFINKTIVNLAYYYKPGQSHLDLIENIKNYFQLEDVVVLTKDNTVFKTSCSNEQIDKFVHDNITQQGLNMQPLNIRYESLTTSQGQYQLYFYPYFMNNDINNVIICVKKEPSNLNKDEVSTLKDSLNLLVVCYNYHQKGSS